MVILYSVIREGVPGRLPERGVRPMCRPDRPTLDREPSPGGSIDAVLVQSLMM